MIQKLLCFLLGHKTVYQAATGQILSATNVLGLSSDHILVKWERSKFCLRCGVLVHDD